MKKITISFVLLMLCASFALGATGDLTFMKQPPPTRSSARMYVSGFKLAGVDKAKGLVNKNALVGTLRGAAGAVMVAIDAAKADATKPELIRLDFSGTGMFKDAPTAPIKMRPAQRNVTMGMIGPVVINAKRDGQSIPVTLQGTYWKQGTRRGLSLMMTVVVEGSCKFGTKTYPVRIIDGNGNLKFADALKPPFRPSTMMPFDRVMVGTDDGKFSSGAATAYIGQPIFIDGKLYSVDISGMKIKAAAMDVAVGSVKVDSPRWNCTLVGKKYFLTVSGGKEAINVPADEYQTANYTLYTSNTPGKRSAYIRGYGSYRGGKSFTVSSGKTAALPIGAPIEATVTSSNSKGKVRMNLLMKDSLGGRISSIANAAGQRPAPPSIQVIDKAGKVVYTAKLGYG
ncbi:MAG: hypothetical protein HN350_00935 [Phycisphaerales bacterium]|jgi:hypothetical protein|nr:hypothetical protein [Phycisphaerales bacterium]